MICTGLLLLFVVQQPRTGVRASEYQTYVERGQWLVMPSLAYSSDHNLEYNPETWGYGAAVDLRGTLRSNSTQLWMAYGLTDWLAVELEGSYLAARFERAPNDTSATPARIRNSGFGDYAAQVRVRMGREKGSRPEIWGAVEIIPAAQKRQLLIGDKITDWKGEFGLTRGYHFGTMTLRTTVEYNHVDHHWDLGETSLEWLRQMSPAWRLLVGIEGGETGAPDEWILVTAGQWRISRNTFLKLSNGFGLMSKSTDWEPQLGVLIVP